MALYRTIHSIDDYFTLQSDISSLSSWIRSISLSLQPAKCCAMIISRKHSHAIAPPTLHIEGVPLPFVTSVKYLGVLITSNLSWSQHVANIHTKVRQLIVQKVLQECRSRHPSSAVQILRQAPPRILLCCVGSSPCQRY